MRFLTDLFTANIDDRLLSRLGWRTVWLHAALTGPPADLLVPRDREVLALVATSALGVDLEAIGVHLSRLGIGRTAARSCVTRLVRLGYLSQTGRRVDLGEADLSWIVAATPEGSRP